jgi:hypothetical protein
MRLVASVRCPTCGARREQPIRIVAEASTAVAKREAITPDLVSICPACNTLSVVSLFLARAT